MPFLELAGEVGEGVDTYSADVMSAMLFPREEEAEKRRNWRAASMVTSYRSWKRSGASPAFLARYHSWLDDLWTLPQSPKRVFEDGIRRSKRARLSGLILAYYLRLAQHHPEHCRVEKSLAVLREEFRRKVPGRRAPSESTLQKVWADFKMVSHLWHAHHMAVGVGKDIDDNADWRLLLSVAEECRRVAESVRLLPSGKTWRAPEGFPLKLPRLEIEPLPPKLLEFLNREFPPG